MPPLLKDKTPRHPSGATPLLEGNYKLVDFIFYFIYIAFYMVDLNSLFKWHDLPFNGELISRAKLLRKARNLPEVLFWKQVKRKSFLGLDFDRQKIIGHYIVDFYCKERCLVIEIDGDSHNDKQEYDTERDAFLTGLGLKVIHISAQDIKKNIKKVMQTLAIIPL